MKEVIAKIMEAEAEARQLVEAAHAEAEQILSAGRESAQTLTAKIRRDTHYQAEQVVRETIREAQQEKQANLARYAADLETTIRLDEAVKHQAVEAALRCVCNPEPEQSLSNSYEE